MSPESETTSARKNDALSEREKELNCLYYVASELESFDTPTDELLGKIVEHIPPGFRFPEVAAARIVLADGEFRTTNFHETEWSISSAIKGNGNQTGTLEVCYLEERPESDEGPFLKQERKRLDCLAGLLAKKLKMLSMAADLTERKQTEEELRKAKVFAENLINTANAIVMSLDTKGNITVFSKTAEEITGYSFEELQGRNWFEVVVPRDRYPQVWMEFEKHIEEGIPEDFENPILTKTGEERFILWKNKEIYEGGQVTGTISFGIDITENKRAEEALRNSESNLQRAQRIGNLGSWSWDVPTNEIDWSDQVFRIYGMDPERTDASFDIVINTLAPECREEFSRAVQDALEKDEPFEGDYCIILADGSRRYTHTAGEVVRDGQGNPLKMFGTVQDITERKKTEEKLRASEERFREVYESSRDGFVLVDTEGKFIDCNLAYSTMLGYTLGELKQQPDFFAITPESWHKWEKEEIWDKKLRTLGFSGVYEKEYMRKDGSIFPVELSSYAIRDAKGEIKYLWGVARDITERKKSEGEKEQLQKQLIQAQKLESVGQLAGGIAHDFNNALQTILGNTTLAMMEVPEGSSLRDSLEAVQRAGEHSADLTRQLLAFARQQPVEPRLVDLNDTIADILGMLKRLMGEDINVAWLPEAKAPMVKLDPAQAYQVLANLCLNSRQAIESIGNVTIETHNITFDEAYVEEHTGFKAGEHIMLELSDDGCGMEKEVLEHVFEPFYTTRAIGKGTGLGLATVYGIVKQNDGFINVYSEAGEGTTFKIYLPQATGSTAAAPKPDPAEPAQGHGEMVLLVEDDLAVLKLSREMLLRLGYKVIAVASPDEAFDEARKNFEDIELLITDVVMPQMNGHDLATKLQELKPGLKCLYMSGYTADIITRQGVLDKGLNFIQKPFSVEDMAAKVRHLLDSE